ncbi:MAG: hypothetical protein Q8M83_06410 [bacterium]|nr:hypothetical protein [bacterium]
MRIFKFIFFFSVFFFLFVFLTSQTNAQVSYCQSGETPCPAGCTLNESCFSCWTPPTCSVTGQTYSTCGSCVCPSATPYICNNTCSAAAPNAGQACDYGGVPGSGTYDNCGICQPNSPRYVSRQYTFPGAAEAGYINITGDVKSARDFYLTDGKALRVDGTGLTNLNIGNWGSGGTGVKLNVFGDIDNAGNGSINTRWLNLDNGICLGGICKASWAEIASGMPVGTTGQTLRHDGTTWSATSDLIVNSIGNVGIKVAPGFPLDIQNSDATGTAILRLANANYTKLWTGLRLDRGSWSERWYLGMNSVNDTLRFRHNGVDDLMVFTEAGALGIGTTSPTALLEVAGTTKVAGLKVTGLVEITGGSPGVGKVLTSDAAGVASWQDSTGLPTATTGQTLRHNGTNWVANSLLYNNGSRVGIGTIAPAESVEIKDDTTGTARLRVTDLGQNPEIQLQHGSGADEHWAFYVDQFAGTALKIWRNISGDIVTINSSGNVGIGTTSPTARLEVAGQIKSTGLNVTGSADVASLLTTNQVKITGGFPGLNKVLTSDASGLASWQSTGLPTGTAGQTLRHNGTNWIADSLFYNNGTFIGVGTTAPAGKLDIAGGYTNSPGLIARTNSLKISASGASPDAAQIYWGDGSGWKLNFGTVGDTGAFVSKVTFVDTGDVGIGTSSPGYPLDVVNNRGVMGTDTAILRLANNNTNKLWTGVRLDRSGLSEKWFIGTNDVDDNLRFRRTRSSDDLIIDTSGNVGIGKIPSSGKLDIFGVVNATGLKAITLEISQITITGGVPGAGKVLTSDAAGFASWQNSTGMPTGSSGQTLRHDGANWLASSLLYNNGSSIGVNTANPNSAYKLDVVGNINASDALCISGTCKTSWSSILPNGQSGQTLRYNGGWLSDNLLFNDGTFIGIGDFTYMDWPLSRLHIRGGQTWGTDLGLDATSTTGGHRWLLVSTGGTASEGQGKFLIKDISGGNRLTIDTSGNVGIGATSPTARLEVAGTIYSSFGGFKFPDGTTVSTAPINYWTKTGNDIYNNTSGNVGIGTTPSASYKLYVRSPASAGRYIGFGNDATGGTILVFNRGGDTNSWNGIQAISGQSVAYGNLALQHEGGNLGVGTTEPNYKLDVAGSANATQLCIGGTCKSAWPIHEIRSAGYGPDTVDTAYNFNCQSGYKPIAAGGLLCDGPNEGCSRIWINNVAGYAQFYIRAGQTVQMWVSCLKY